MSASQQLPRESTDLSNESGPAPKKARVCEETNQSSNDEILDLAEVLGFRTGDRIEVQWDIQQDGDEPITHWWGATLQDHDGRVADSAVAIRVLEYDPYPEGGFDEKSKEDVIFMGDDVLVNPTTREELSFRRVDAQHDGEIRLGRDRQAVESIINLTLQNVMAKKAGNWNNLTSSQKSSIAATIKSKKEGLLEQLLNHPNTVVTADDMKDMLDKVINPPPTVK